MIYQRISSRILGLVTFTAVAFGSTLLHSGLTFAASKRAEVAVEHKQDDRADFQLAEYRTELLQCSALSAIHMWIGDNLSEEGAQVRQQLDEEYWLKTSKDYLALANQASGEADLTEEVGAAMKILTAEWRHLTEEKATTDEWQQWYALTERCDSWRADPPKRPYLNNVGRTAANSSSQAPTTDSVSAGVLQGSP